MRRSSVLPVVYNDLAKIIAQVIQAYEKEGFDMMLKAFNDQKYLETLTGLDKLYDEGEEALKAVDWDAEDSEEEF